MAKVEIIEIDRIKLKFKFRIYDITAEFWGAEIWWKAGPIPEPTMDGWSDEVMMTFDGIETIPRGVSECYSDELEGYKWTEYSDVTPDYGTTHFKVGLIYHFSFNYVKGEEFGVFDSIATAVHKDSSSYGAVLPLTIKQVYPGSTDADFECDFSGLFEGTETALGYSKVTIFYADGTAVKPSFFYIDIGEELNVLERTDDLIKWRTTVGDTFNTPIGFYIQTETHTRPNIDSSWDSPYATHSASQSETVYVTLVDEDAPACEIIATFDDESYTYDGTRVTGTIKNCPMISAADWNQFCLDINAVRAMATEKGIYKFEWYFETVEAGKTKMSASLFQNVFDAVCDTCPTPAVEVPESNVYFEEGRDISGEALVILLGRLKTALQQSRDFYWSYGNTT